MKKSNLNRPLSEMTETENELLSEGFIVLNPEEKSAIKGGDRNNGTCSGNATCNRNGICKGNGGRCVGNDHCVNGSSSEEEAPDKTS